VESIHLVCHLSASLLTGICRHLSRLLPCVCCLCVGNRFKKDMESLEENVDPWERVSRGKRVNLREFEAKLRLLSARIASR